MRRYIRFLLLHTAQETGKRVVGSAIQPEGAGEKLGVTPNPNPTRMIYTHFLRLSYPTCITCTTF